MASRYGLTPDGWQEDVLSDWLGRRRDGQWAAATCGLAVPRQNGKNGIIEVRELYGMAILGEKFLHTAHEVKTARKAFIRIASFFENEREFPELASLVLDIRKTNGQEAILLKNGGGVEFIARSRGSGRGFTVDVLVCDEAQDLSDEELAALLPTISAAPLGNPQVIVTGTPPDPLKLGHGEVFRRVRADGEAKRDARLAWTDYGAADGPLPDVDDTAAWVVHNPAMGIRLAMQEVERERGLMSAETFARERLGYWGDPKGIGGPFAPGAWGRCSVEVDEPPVPAALGVAADVDQVWLSLGAASGGELPHLGAVLRVRVDQQLPHFVSEVARIQSELHCPVVVDVKGPASFIIEDLEAAGVEVTRGGLDDYVQACSDMKAGVESVPAGVEHSHYDELDMAVAVAGWRTAGDRKVFARKAGEISMLEAVTWAMWAVSRISNYDIMSSIA
jgi:hypothetical protein